MLTINIPEGALEGVQTVAPLGRGPGGGHRLLRSAILRTNLLRLAMTGLPASRAAKLVGCSPRTAMVIYRETAFRQKVLSRVEGALAYADEMYESSQIRLHQKLKAKSEEAFQVLCGFLDDDKYPTLRFKAAVNILDRNEDTASTSRHTHEHEHRFSAEQLATAAEEATTMRSRPRLSAVPINKSGA